jgi:hypothetical protein
MVIFPFFLALSRAINCIFTLTLFLNLSKLIAIRALLLIIRSQKPFLIILLNLRYKIIPILHIQISNLTFPIQFPPKPFYSNIQQIPQLFLPFLQMLQKPIDGFFLISFPYPCDIADFHLLFSQYAIA